MNLSIRNRAIPEPDGRDAASTDALGEPDLGKPQTLNNPKQDTTSFSPN